MKGSETEAGASEVGVGFKEISCAATDCSDRLSMLL